MLYYAANRLLLIVIVTVCSKNIHIDLRFKDTVNKPMPIGYPSAPPTFRLPFERFWMPGTKNALSRRKMPFGNPTEYQWVTKSAQTG